MKAEEIKNGTNEIDWNDNPQLVVDENGSVVMVTIGQSKSESGLFSGVCVLVGEGSRDVLGDYSIIWRKNCFSKYNPKNEIKLKND